MEPVTVWRGWSCKGKFKQATGIHRNSCIIYLGISRGPKSMQWATWSTLESKMYDKLNHIYIYRYNCKQSKVTSKHQGYAVLSECFKIRKKSGRRLKNWCTRYYILPFRGDLNRNCEEYSTQWNERVWQPPYTIMLWVKASVTVLGYTDYNTGSMKQIKERIRLMIESSELRKPTNRNAGCTSDMC